MACAQVEALRVGLEFGAKMFINSMMEQYAITNSGGNRVKPAKLVKTDLVKVTLDLCSVSDICGHSLSYPKAVSAFPGIPGPKVSESGHLRKQ